MRRGSIRRRLPRVFDFVECVGVFDAAHIAEILTSVGFLDRPPDDHARLCLRELGDEQYFAGPEQFALLLADQLPDFLAQDVDRSDVNDAFDPVIGAGWRSWEWRGRK